MPISTIGSNSLNQTSDLTINGVTVGKGGGSVSTNTAVGASALSSNSAGTRNTAVGSTAASGVTGSRIVAIGDNVLATSTSGNDNVAIGDYTMRAYTGSGSTAVGAQALANGTSNSGDYNTAVGAGALNASAGAQYNTSVGYSSGSTISTGSRNTFIGAWNSGSQGSGSLVTTGSANTILGAYNGNQNSLDIRTASNNIVLSDGDGNPRAGVNSNGWFGVNQGGSSTPYYNSTYHRINSSVSQGSAVFTISSYPTTNNDSITVYAVTGGNANAAGTTLWLSANNSTARSINAAGTINASGSDYAEYMTKCSDFTVAKGEIIGIDANGLLTNVFTDAVTFVVKSTDPSYVGGDKWFNERLKDDATEQEKEEFEQRLQASRALVDRVAFCGQVPVNVMGATAGQYVIPVNDNGAIKGQAVSNPTFEQYQIAVGKVIAIESDGRAKIIVKVA